MIGEERALLISLRPRFAEAILLGVKTVELRRTRLRIGIGATVLLYASGPISSLVGSARVRSVETGPTGELWSDVIDGCGLTRSEFDEYFAGCRWGTAVGLERARRLESELPLSVLRVNEIEPPQSFRYLTPAQVDRLVPGAVNAEARPYLPSLACC